MGQIVVKLGAYKGIEIPKLQVEITEAELNNELERARMYAAKTADKGDAPAEMGDECTIDFKGFIDGEAFTGGEGADYPLTLGSKSFIPGFEEQLVGAKKGDEVDVKVPFPADYHAAELAGKDAVFKCTVKNVRSTVIPELSDEMVSQISPCKTVDEFKVYVQEQMINTKNDIALQQKENKLLDAVIANSEIEVPEENAVERKDAMVQGLVNQLRNSGMTLDDYLQYNNMSKEDFDKYALNDAYEMLKGQAVLLMIAESEKITVKASEVEAQIESMAMQYQMDANQLKASIGSNGMNMVREDILCKRALDILVENAVEV